MKRDLTKGNVTYTMLLFAVPMILGNVLQQCYNLADTWIVGRYIGSDALAAVGSAYTLMTFLTSVITGMCMGSGALFSIHYGKKDIKKMREYMLASFFMILGVTVLLSVLSFGFLDGILHLMRIPEDIGGMMHDYVWNILFGLVFIFLYNYFAFLLRSVGNSVAPLAFLGVSTVLNIFLDYVFVAVWKMDASGAAQATVLSQIVSGTGIGIYAFLKEPVLRGRSRSRKGEAAYIEQNKDNGVIAETDEQWMPEQGIRITGVRAQTLKEIFTYSISTGIQQSVMNFGILMVQGLVNSFGTAVMAAFAAGVKIETLAYMPAQEFGNAYSIFVSQNYGAGKKERIRAGTRSAFLTAAVFCLLVSAGVVLQSRRLMEIFIAPQETEIIQIGVGYLKIVGTFYTGIGILFLLYGYFRAVERPELSLVLTIISLGTRVAIAYLCAPAFGYELIWAAIPTGWILADVTGLLLRRHGMRAEKRF